jgi:hypothetical protein
MQPAVLWCREVPTAKVAALRHQDFSHQRRQLIDFVLLLNLPGVKVVLSHKWHCNPPSPLHLHKHVMAKHIAASVLQDV